MNLFNNSPSNLQTNQNKKKRRNQSKSDKDIPRFQCFCDKVYLSYPALYLHLKNKHQQYFNNNKKVEPTKFKQLFDQKEGYKVFKMEKQGYYEPYQETYKKHQNLTNEGIKLNKNSNNFDNIYYNKSNFGSNGAVFSNSFPPFFVMPQNRLMNYEQYYMLNKPPAINAPLNLQKQLKLQKSKIPTAVEALNQYLEDIQQNQEKNIKQIKQIQLLFHLLLKCAKIHPQLLYLTKQLPEEREMTSANIFRIFDYFQNKFVPNFKEFIDQCPKNQRSNLQFFYNHCSIIKNGNFSKQLQKFMNWLEARKYGTRKIKNKQYDSFYSMYIQNGDNVQNESNQN